VPVSPLLCLHDIMLQTSSAVNILLYNQRQQHKCIWHRPWPTRFKPFAHTHTHRKILSGHEMTFC
jgi:hypothetical protein